jgi:hypothetical protein
VRTKYERFYIKFSRINNLGYDDTAYQLLIDNFKKLGFLDDADNCYYQFRLEQFWHRKPRDNPLRYLLDFGACILYGFGIKPEFSVGWSILVIVIFGLLWGRFNRLELVHPIDNNSPEVDKSEKRCPQDSTLWDMFHALWVKLHTWLEPFSFSARIFLSGTKLFINPPSIPEHLSRSKPMLRDLFTLERVLGALFSVLFFLAISRTVIR